MCLCDVVMLVHNDGSPSFVRFGYYNVVVTPQFFPYSKMFTGYIQSSNDTTCFTLTREHFRVRKELRSNNNIVIIIIIIIITACKYNSCRHYYEYLRKVTATSGHFQKRSALGEKAPKSMDVKKSPIIAPN